ncbi:MAG: AAA family ATPase [Holosporales bacterium]|jgi:DNA replication and repair protein RecF|nr:AAA family ATPase [Holosporales bacterium]
MISSIYVHNFRNYFDANIFFEKRIIVFYGPNGAGKTNLLEAISMFAVGNGLKNCPVQEISNTVAINGQWAVKITLNRQISLATGLASTANNNVRRIFKIQDAPVKSASQFHEYINIISITPSMDHLFSDSASIRRKFIDDFISSYSPIHSKNLQDYEKAMKQRLTILKKEIVPDTRWLSSLEEIMAEKNILISKSRNIFVEILKFGQNAHIELFPKFESKIEGKAEGIEKDEIIQILEKNREKDQICGMTTFGCHRSDWVVTHLKNNRLVKDCSTGEQKITLISVILSFVNQKLKKNDKILTLLLDDIVARLDLSHRVALFEQIYEICRQVNNDGLQVFFSGTDAESFGSLKDSQSFLVSNASINYCL